jgi:hypothetical protein
LLQHGNAGCIDIQTQDIIALLCKAGSGDKTDVTGANDGDFHLFSPAISGLSLPVPLGEL